MTNMKSYWDKYAAQRRAQRSSANLLRQRGVGVRRQSDALASSQSSLNRAGMARQGRRF